MKPVSIAPKATTRAAAFELWMNAPNPTVTFFKTLDVTPLVRLSRGRGLKFNMLMCYCIGRAASGIKEFYTLPVGQELLQYDSIAVNTIVKNRRGEVSSCDVPFSDNLDRFSADYLRLTRETAERCENHDLTESMVIGTSAIVDTEIDGAVGMYSGGHVQRHFQQSVHHLGQISRRAVQDDVEAVVPVPPHAGGRRARRALPAAFAGKHLQHEAKTDLTHKRIQI